MPALPISLGVSGTESFSALSRRLNEAATSLAQEVDSAIDRAIDPLPGELRASALSLLPKRGGLNEDVARSTITVTHRSDGASAEVAVTASSQDDIDEIDGGTVRHPLFGNKLHWYVESVTPGWWSRPIQAASVRVRPELDRAVATVTRRIEG